MMLLAGILALAIIFGSTYFVLTSVGLRRDNLLYTPNEKRGFDRLMGGRLGGYATVANIFATLSSFATVCVFFIGAASTFGVYTIACAISLVFGVFVTNAITRRIVAIPRVRVFYQSLQQTSAVVAAIVWSDGKNARANSCLVKYISMCSIIAVIWLEFAIFSDFSGYLSGRSDALFRACAFFLVGYCVLYFVLRFGLRGFVFTDLIQSPVILVGSVILLLCSVFAMGPSGPPGIGASALRPTRPLAEVALFIANAIVVNLFWVLASEAHWMRVWLFGERETRLQFTGVICAAANWIMLSLIGIFAGFASSGPGSVAGADVIQFMQSYAPITAIAFWLAAVSALFATADTNVYALLLVNSFDSGTGSVTGARRSITDQPAIAAFFSAVAMAAVYYLVRSAGLPMEKIMFVFLPLCLNIVPSLISVASFREPRLGCTIASTVGYVAISVVGLLEPPQQLLTTLAAALCPVVFSIVAIAAPSPVPLSKEATS